MAVDKVVLTEADKRRMAFDHEFNVEPCRTVAEKIGHRWGLWPTVVEEIAWAIEDARRIGELRARAEAGAISSTEDGDTK